MLKPDGSGYTRTVDYHRLRWQAGTRDCGAREKSQAARPFPADQQLPPSLKFPCFMLQSLTSQALRNCPSPLGMIPWGSEAVSAPTRLAATMGKL